MDIKKAKEILECNEEQESLEKLGYIDKREFLRDWDVAFEIAIKSLDMWNKTIKEIEEEASQYCSMYYDESNVKYGLETACRIVESHKEEVENG